MRRSTRVRTKTPYYRATSTRRKRKKATAKPTRTKRKDLEKKKAACKEKGQIYDAKNKTNDGCRESCKGTEVKEDHSGCKEKKGSKKRSSPDSTNNLMKKILKKQDELAALFQKLALKM